MNPETKRHKAQAGQVRPTLEHLSEFELDEALMGDATSSTSAHLETCADCARQLALLAQPIASFRSVSLAWSERRSATLPLRIEPAPKAHWTVRHGWVAAMIALVVALLAIPGHLGDRKPGPHAAGNAADASTPGNPAAPHSAAAQGLPVESASATSSSALEHGAASAASAEELRRQQQIAEDNRMLAAIDHELDASQATLAAFGVDVSASRSHAHGRTPAGPAGHVVQE